jgi:hypothetical protein
MTTKPLVKITKAMPKVSKKLARRGDTNILWLIVAVIGVVIGVAIVFTVARGVIPSISAGNALAVSAEELGGVLTVDIKAMGTSTITITAINLLPSGTSITSVSGCSAYYNGRSQSRFSLPFTLNPGDTLSLVCNPAPSGVTQVQVITTTGTYTAPIS